jgi:hypothetical protein
MSKTQLQKQARERAATIREVRQLVVALTVTKRHNPAIFEKSNSKEAPWQLGQKQN